MQQSLVPKDLIKFLLRHRIKTIKENQRTFLGNAYLSQNGCRDTKSAESERRLEINRKRRLAFMMPEPR